MSREQRELLEQIDNLKVEMKNYLDSSDIENAKAKKVELEALKEKLELYQDIDNEIKLENYVEVKETMENKKNAVVEFKNALVKREGSVLVPNEEMNVIEEFRREQIALKGLCRVINTNSGKGQMPVGVDEEQLLANLTEGEEIPQSAVAFGVVSYDVKDYGDIIPVSRQVLQDEACGLMEFIGHRFAKKAVHTENVKILDILMGEEVPAVEEANIITGLKKALNVKLNPANAKNAVIICNQTYFDKLDNEMDGFNRPVLQPNIADPTRKMFAGHEVIVLADAELNLNGYIVADMANAVLFADRVGVEVAISEEAGFTRNVVYARVIERFDVQKIDHKAVCVVKVN